MKPKRVKVMKHRIVTNDALPQFRKPFGIPHAFEEEANKQVNEMLENDIIRPSASPWNTPVMPVKKKDQGLRFVCGFRAINDVTKKDTYPLPLIKDVVDRMGGSMFWTKLDAASTYWSMPLEEQDKEKTAFPFREEKLNSTKLPMDYATQGHHISE